MKNKHNKISKKEYSNLDLEIKNFMEKSQGTREILLKFTQDFCSLIEIYGFRFQLIVFNKKEYGVDEAIKLIEQLNRTLNSGFFYNLDDFFQTEMEMEFLRGDKVMMNLSDEGDYYQVRSKNPYHNDDYKFPKKDFLKYADKMYVFSNEKLLLKLRDFIAQVDKKKNKEKDIVFDQQKNKSKLYITKDGNDYFYNGKLVKIKNPKANYFIIFDAVYHLAENGGDVEYEKIIECCKKRNLPRTNRKKVQKALTGESADFFKHIKIDRILSGGINLFEADPNGNFLTFNNTKN
jgi:hypothetical protein